MGLGLSVRPSPQPELRFKEEFAPEELSSRRQREQPQLSARNLSADKRNLSASKESPYQLQSEQRAYNPLKNAFVSGGGIQTDYSSGFARPPVQTSGFNGTQEFEQYASGGSRKEGQVLTLRSQSKGRSEEEERREKTKMKPYTQSALGESSPKPVVLQKAESMEISKDNYVPIGFNNTGQFSQNKELYPRVLDGFGQGGMSQTYQAKPPVNTGKTQFVDVSTENLKDK